MTKKAHKPRVSEKQDSSAVNDESTGRGPEAAPVEREMADKTNVEAGPTTASGVRRESRDAEVAAEPDEQQQEEREQLVEVPAAEFEQLQAEKEEYYDRVLRLRAEFDNYKKRIQKEFDSVRKYAAEDVVQELLPVLDNFERALSNVPEGVNDGFREGIEIIHRQLREALGKAGLSPMEVVGQEFDPNLHHALMQVQSDDHEEGTVVEEFHKGYRLFDKVIRHAKVAVSSGGAKKGKPSEAAEHDEDGEQGVECQ